MPFGLCNASATFECLMETVLGGLSHEVSLVYLDDIIIVVRSYEEHPSATCSVGNSPISGTLFRWKIFFDLYTYYQKFVKNSSTIARPLHKLTEAKQKFIWSGDCDNAFNKLKDALTSAPALAYSEIGKQFIWDTDASHECIRAELSQEIDGQEHVIAYCSTCLSKPERNYCVTRK
ncbi:retrovirus-related Pol polyprotein from transposon 17.6 [Trichonephila clavipes]|nr:retrovirus-related Pol polyprotein from transposon 17.6 [Trichonephila clavipes]